MLPKIKKKKMAQYKKNQLPTCNLLEEQNWNKRGHAQNWFAIFLTAYIR